MAKITIEYDTDTREMQGFIDMPSQRVWYVVRERMKTQRLKIQSQFDVGPVAKQMVENALRQYHALHPIDGEAVPVTKKLPGARKLLATRITRKDS